ncbi:hypothetical protein CASFOL_028210 [Castilleja foliolosa]|uniref:Uncharacterized protein n=1 Tax=Castilleja foliolosa TaxID=1961234 RepID=A0ABD3CD31_9LAMI
MGVAGGCVTVVDWSGFRSTTNGGGCVRGLNGDGRAGFSRRGFHISFLYHGDEPKSTKVYEFRKTILRAVGQSRRVNALREVVERAYLLGSPRAIPIQTDISKLDDFRRLIEEAINQFGRLDHLVLSAGVTTVSLFEDTFNVTNFSPAMASKTAVVSFFETLQIEFAPDIGITIVTPGLIESEMTKGKFLTKKGEIVFDQDIRDVSYERVVGAYIVRIPFGAKYKYIPKELLWPHVSEFVDGALSHIIQMSKVLGEDIGNGKFSLAYCHPWAL